MCVWGGGGVKDVCVCVWVGGGLWNDVCLLQWSVMEGAEGGLWTWKLGKRGTH